MAGGRGAHHRAQVASRSVVPRRVLHGVQEQSQQGSAHPGSDADERDQPPEAGAVPGDDALPRDVGLVREVPAHLIDRQAPSAGVRNQPVCGFARHAAADPVAHGSDGCLTRLGDSSITKL